MIPVPNSRIIEFIHWIKLRNHQEYLVNLDDDSLYELARVFLKDKILHPPKRADSLKLIMELYQNFPFRITEPVERMREFCYRLEYTYIEGIAIKENKPLNLFLKKFMTFANALGYKNWFDNRFFDYFENERELTCDGIISFIKLYGSSLEKTFRDYCNQVNQKDFRAFNDFLRNNNFRKEDTDDYPMEQAAGLADSIRELIHGESYDEILAKNEAMSEYLCLIGGLSTDVVQGITFIEWLNKKYPSINLLGNIPSIKIDQWSREFCNSKQYSNVSDFTRDIKKMLNSEQTNSITFNRIMRYIRKRSPHLEVRNDLISRYDTVLMHGMFIFTPRDNFSEFIEVNWINFNYILGDKIDVYYSLQDLKGRTGQSIDQYEYLNVELNDYPAFIFWSENIEKHTVISFNGLTEHTDIAELFQKIIVAGIRSKEPNENIKKNAEAWKLHRMAERKLEIVMKNGGFSMNIYKGQNFVNNGGNMEVKGNVIQQTDGTNNFKFFEEQDFSSLRKLVQALKDNTHEDLSEDLALQGASIISGLIKVSEEKNEQLQATKLIEFNSWKHEIGENGLKVLAIIADLTTLTIPVLSLLGYTNF